MRANGREPDNYPNQPEGAEKGSQTSCLFDISSCENDEENSDAHELPAPIPNTLPPPSAGEPKSETTNTKVLRETTDREAMPTIPLALPHAGTKTAVTGEGEDFFVNAQRRWSTDWGRWISADVYIHPPEAPQNDDKRHCGAGVLPPC